MFYRTRGDKNPEIMEESIIGSFAMMVLGLFLIGIGAYAEVGGILFFLKCMFLCFPGTVIILLNACKILAMLMARVKKQVHPTD